MNLFLDTTILIDHLRGVPGAVGIILEAAQTGDGLWSLTPVRTEVLAGMRKPEEAATRRLLDTLQWLEVTREVADLAGTYANQYLRSHTGVDTIDYLIAAGAVLLPGELKTTNVRHFPMFPGLKPPY